MKKFCVISHTHWDREWYQPLEQFRMRLVDLIDNLLGIIEEFPDYVFHLDAQTIVLEDYLEIKPQNREILKRHIKNGNILVGPWYVQNDFYLTSGEATVRNLQYGIELANEFGACERVGYAPDQFGLSGQLPQIFREFNIDSCIFGRGYTCFIYWELGAEEFAKTAPPSEFVWEGSDGSKVLGIHMSYWYNNCQRLSADEIRALKLVQKIEGSFEGIATTPYLLLMNGVDHLEAQENLLPILEKLNENLPDGKEIEQATLTDYVNLIKEYHGVGDFNTFNPTTSALTTFSGELRNGGDGNILQNTLSSHIYLKNLNARAQNLLECFIEPLYTMISMAGADIYPKEYLDYLWKLLIKNHPHDSICGCSHDHVHNQMEGRYQRIFDLGDQLAERGMKFIADHAAVERNDRDYIVSLFNFSEQPYSGVVNLKIELVKEDNISGFEIFDSNGIKLDFCVIEKSSGFKNYYSPINLPGESDTLVYDTRIYAENLAPMSVSNFVLKPVEKPVNISGKLDKASDLVVMENEFIKTEINSNGTVNIFDKKNNTFYEDIFYLIDREDVGDAYVTKYSGCEPFTSKDGELMLSVTEETALSKICRATYTMMLPFEYDDDKKKRSDLLMPYVVNVDFSLSKGAKWLSVDFDFDNNIKDHRLRAVFNTGVKSDFTHALAPYDVVCRDVKNTMNGYHNGDQPNSGFVNICDDIRSVSVLNSGVYEYQHMNSGGVLEFTLVRSVRGFANYDFKGQQVQRNLKIAMAIMPHSLESSEMVHSACKQFQCGVTASCYPADTKKFLGGRSVVQDTDIKETFYRQEAYADIDISHTFNLGIDIDDCIGISAFKKTLDGTAYILRLMNYSDDTKSADITSLLDRYSIETTNLEECGSALSSGVEKIRGKEIKTFLLKERK